MFQPAHQDITGSVFTTKKMRTGLAITLHLTCSLILLYAIKFDIETTEERFGAGFLEYKGFPGRLKQLTVIGMVMLI